MAGTPKASERLVDKDGKPTWAWYRVFTQIGSLVSLDDVTAFFRELLIRLGSSDGTLENLPPITTGSFMPISANVQGDYSVESNGILANGIVSITLVNDEFEPLPTYFYGTSAAGARGWQPIADTIVEGVGIELTVDGVGVTTIALAALADAGGGALQKTNRDIYGRLAGTSAATTDDLTEGATNLYFTTERAQDAAGAAIAAGTGDGATLTYNDAGNAIDVTNTDKGSVAVTAHEAAADPHPQYLTHAEVMARVSLRF